MNLEEVLKAMLDAAANAAKGDWKRMRGFAEKEFKQLAKDADAMREKYLEEITAAAGISDAAEREKAVSLAGERARFTSEELKSAAEVALLVAVADVKLAAQKAINSAMNVLKEAINASLGVAVL